MGSCNTSTKHHPHQNHLNNNNHPQQMIQSGNLINNNVVQNIKPTTNFKPGERYLIQKRELERLKSIPLGGAARVELFLSLKPKNPSAIVPDITINVAVSSISNSKQFIDLKNTGYIDKFKLEYSTTYVLDYCFETHQYLKFDVNLNNKFVETIESTIGRIFGSRGHTMEFPIINIPDFQLVVNIRVKNMDTENLNVVFNIQPKINASDVFVIFSANINEKFQPIYKSSEQNISNIKTSVSFLEICNGDYDVPILFEIYNLQMGILGRYKGSLNQITNSNGIVSLDNGSQSGINFKIEKDMKFLDYIQEGLQISLMCGIDYTGSNGDPLSPQSKHYLNSPEPNHYEQAILTCCSIVAYYDYNGSFPVYGFGAVLPGSTIANNCFPINFSQNPEINGLEEIIKYYKMSFSNLKLSGPTYLTPLLKSMLNNVISEINNNNQSTNIYYMFLILTDGLINDLDSTAEVICECAKYPISIIIIGIGDDDFGAMESLDGDDSPLKDRYGNPVIRDIVQFVRFNKYKSNLDLLSKEVLCELPKQVETYFKCIKPFIRPL